MKTTLGKKFFKKVRFLLKLLYFNFFYKQLFKDYHFTIYKTKSLVEREALYRLRYHVYCEEYSYLDKNKFPDHMERDEYDEYSDNFIIRDKDEQIAACVRVILNSPLGFPIEKHFKLEIDTGLIDPRGLVEISRLIVAKKYRKKSILLFLVKGLYLYALEQHITHAYFIIDEKLYPLLVKMKIPVVKIGQSSFYQGLTFPCILDIAEWERSVKKSRSIYKFYYFGGIDPNGNGDRYEVH